MITTVIKRDGERVKFDEEKVVSAISRAFCEVYSTRSDNENSEAAKKVAAEVTKALGSAGDKEMSVEAIQDVVEKTLMVEHQSVAKSYIVFRQKRAELRAFRASLGIPDDGLKLPLNTVTVLAARYLLKDTTGKIVESPKQLFHRVARAISEVEKHYGKTEEQVLDIEQQFYDAMTNFRFMPNSPTLMNAGTKLGQLSACFVLPVGDSLPEIFNAVRDAALIHQSGGGTGFAFSRLRPKNDIVKSTSGVASGPISFMKVFDAATEQIKQGGKRRGANMGILRVDHPDILEFIMAKEREGVLSNFNISVAITEKFMKAVDKGTDYELVNPHNGLVMGRLNAKAVWNLIVTMALKTGDPGLVFLDRINASYANPVPSYGPVESTNPCGEQPLYPYDSCNLGSINLARMVKNTDHHYEVDWDLLESTIRLGTRFLDNVIDANNYPLEEIKRTSNAVRRIGLGVMGWADMLIKLGIRYDSNEALMLAEKVMSFITDKGREMSEELAVERGPFPEFENSVWYRLGHKPLRNSTVTTIAPTGTISIITGGASQGIEPIFSVVYMRNVHESLGSNLIEVNNEFESYALEHNFYSEELMKKLAGLMSIQEVEEVPEKVRRLFVTAFDIAPEWHVRMQAAFQKYTDNAVSKTINFPAWATPQDIERAYSQAYKLGCKGITVYRDSSKSVQVLQTVDHNQKSLASLKAKHEAKDEARSDVMQRVSIEAIRSGAGAYVMEIAEAVKCPDCSGAMVAAEGCYTCPKCGHSECG